MTNHTARLNSRRLGAEGTTPKAFAAITAAAALVMLTSASPAYAFSAGVETSGDTATCQGQVPTIYVGPEQRIVFATEGDDVIVAVGHLHTIHSLGGDDLICTFGSQGDTIVGGPGNDRIFTWGGDDVIYGGDGADEVHGGGGHDVIHGDDGNDVLFGGAGSDLIIGDGGDDTMHGGDGDDRLRGLIGNNDKGDGGAGDDLCRFGTEHRTSCGTWTRD
ncbi:MULTISPECIES: calcium-binding protein [unclassified Nocardioides]|uniref:calcium-binding protein n=1 Tax=unclassified Nocardioides TaxID=2615069 RepID=UPI0007019A6A|nr:MULTISPECIES: calcium-binding protein [unclassified Nocardioides]KRA31018.1 hypothetical protein ASD81_16100 [Nocardioides sp. Root614]KRA87639.1 hypothetical protein ASD84_16375 [Nocardioides sp. Root682]